MSYETLLFEHGDGRATLTLNRPERLNSITEQMHAELHDALKRVQGNPAIHCLVLTGAGRAFCSGQDLSERVFADEGSPPDLGESLEKRYNPLILTLRTLEVPVVCAVNGVAAGAGCNLALAGDIVLAARSASFVQSSSKLGLVPDAGGTWILPRLIGHARARGLAMLGEPLSADQAQAWGMIWQSIDDACLVTETDALARQLAERPARGLALSKRAFNASAANTLQQQLDLERDLQQLAGREADYREAVSAFLDKRTPRFKGE